ncbi:YhgE/Pip domain-containing protein [Cohnella zeiphila]|uniref:YhgE/Pip domain-containing protein n=1 Tax=Cohnella zeiphila TaxID=2761120 RepID=A0A7X0SM42_9BACL|nr:YhgE/Pip domain-containing protein [Cohnella zeiphila]MBB6732466.1 YhgE/Pip domain-containing protein [Cohnella zeiphila]
MRGNRAQGDGVVRGEFRRLTGSRMAMLSMVGLMVIPLLYSGMLIGAFWDPYGKLDRLPVAVVNEDAGASMEGRELHVGSDLVDQLKNGSDFKWSFTDEKEAMDGLKDHRYSMAFVIPANFSKQATTLRDEDPQPAQIEYYVDDGYNYLSSRIGADAAESLRTEVGREVTKAYASAVFSSVGEAAEGFKDAAGGASKLADGAKEAEAGAQRLHDNLAKLSGGALELKQGLGKLTDGAAKVASGANAVAGGGATLSAGLGQLTAGSVQLQSGVAQAADASGQLKAGADSLAAGGRKLADAADAAKAGSESVADGADQLAAGLRQYAEAHGGLADDAAFRQLLAAADSVAAGAGQLRQGAGTLADSADQLAAGQSRLAQSAADWQAGAAKLKQGADALAGKLKEAAGGADALADGARQVADGAKSLQTGLGDASGGLQTVAEGSKELTDGSQSLAGGVSGLLSGSEELAGKLGDASQQASELQGTDKQAGMFADPVSVSEHKLANVPNYGTGMTPYFLSLGLYVGVLMSTVILPLRDAAGTVRGGFRWYLSKLLLFAPIVLLQTVLADTVLIAGLGLQVPNVPLFYAVSAAIGLTFMTIVQFLSTLADTIGRFVAVVLLTLQLASSAGTYPAELLPTWLQRIGEWMPMTHAIRAVRYTLTGGEASSVGHELLLLAAYAAPFVALTLLLFRARSRRADRFRPHDPGTRGESLAANA